MFCLLHNESKHFIITAKGWFGYMMGPDIGVGVAVINDERVLLVKESGGKNVGCWGIPKGKVDPSENIEQAALRELFEETGLQGELIRLTGLRSDLRNNQVALFFVFTATVDSKQVPKIQDKGEISDIGWFTADEVKHLDLVSTNMSILIKGAFEGERGLMASEGNGVVYV